MKRLTVVFMLMLSALTANAGEKITLATLDWGPYIGQGLRNEGYVAVLVKEALSRSGFEAEFQYFPWNRALGLAKTGKVDGYFPEYYAESVTAFAVYSHSFPGGPIGFFKMTGSPVAYETLEDLKGLRIGTVKGYINTRAFDEATFLEKDPVKDDLTNFKKLLAGRIDLLVADKFVGLHLIAQHMPGQAHRISFMSPPLEKKDLFVCISKKTKDPQRLLEAFNRGLESMKEDGTVERILAEYGF